MSYPGLEQTFVPSTAIEAGRTVWEFVPERVTSDAALLFLDGEFYLEHVRAVEILKGQWELKTIPLVSAFALPTFPAYFVAAEKQTNRVKDFCCNHQFAAFITGDVLPEILTRHHGIDPQKVILVGASLGGLAAALI